MITRLEIENFKAIRSLAVDLGPLTCLVGPNDAGKSTILQALELLGQLSRRRVWAPIGVEPTAILHGDEPLRVLRDGDREGSLRLRVVGNLRDTDYAFSVVLSYRGDAFEINRNDLRFGDKEIHGGGGPWSILHSHVEHPGVRDVAADLAAFSASFDPHKLVIPAAADDALQTDGFGLASVIDALLTDVDRTARDAYEATLRRFSPHVIAIGTRPAAASPEVLGVALPAKSRKEVTFGMPGNRTVPASHASGGLLLAAAYIALRHTGYRRFLIDEPENGVHPRALLQIIDVLRELATEGRQVVMTTHSPILLDYLEPADIRIVTRDAAAGVKVTPALASKAFHERSQKLDMGEVWYALGDEEIVASAS